MNFGVGSCLKDFQMKAKNVWYAVSDEKVAINWYEVTGTSWDAHKDGIVENFHWSDVVPLIRRDDSEYSLENNIKFIDKNDLAKGKV